MLFFFLYELSELSIHKYLTVSQIKTNWTFLFQFYCTFYYSTQTQTYMRYQESGVIPSAKLFLQEKKILQLIFFTSILWFWGSDVIFLNEKKRIIVTTTTTKKSISVIIWTYHSIPDSVQKKWLIYHTNRGGREWSGLVSCLSWFTLDLISPRQPKWWSRRRRKRRRMKVRSPNGPGSVLSLLLNRGAVILSV